VAAADRDAGHASGIRSAQTYQAAWADFNRDGYFDLMTGGRLYQNPGGAHAWLKVKVHGSGAIDASALGTQVRLRLGDRTLTRPVESSTGQGNQNDLTLHFGLGDHRGPVRLEVAWLDGRTRTLTVDPRQTVVVERE
jgi:hypothetical protein